MNCTIEGDQIKCDKGGGMVTYVANTPENRERLGLEVAETPESTDMPEEE